MEIRVLQNFMDGRDRYVAGEIRVVPDNKGGLFVGVGWAEDISGKTPTSTQITGRKVTLTMHDASHVQSCDNVR